MAAARDAEGRGLLLRTVVGAILAAPVVAIAMTHGSVAWLHGAWTEWVQAVLGTAAKMKRCRWETIMSSAYGKAPRSKSGAPAAVLIRTCS